MKNCLSRQVAILIGWSKRDGRREDSWLGHLDLGALMDAVECICLRAGNLKSRLERENERVVRMMSNLEQDKTLLEIRNLWNLELGEASH